MTLGYYAWHTGTNLGPHTDSVPRTSLIVRTIATVGNYDYIYDIRFRLDASIKVGCMA